MRNSQIEVRPIAGSIGAEIHNVDVSQELDDAHHRRHPQGPARPLRHLLPRPEARRRAHKAFTRRFGEIFIHPNYKGMQADPEIIQITREPGDKKIVGEDWHADTTMMRGAADGRHPLRHRGAAVRRRYAVRQPVPGLRGALGRHEENAVGPAGRPLGPQGGGPAGQQERPPRRPRCARTPTGARR